MNCFYVIFQVYPAALRAQKRRQLQISLAEKQRAKSAQSEQRRRARCHQFQAQMERETSNWLSEYQRHYVGYEGGVYSRSARAAIPRAADHAEIGQLPPEHSSAYLRASV